MPGSVGRSVGSQDHARERNGLPILASTCGTHGYACARCINEYIGAKTSISEQPRARCGLRIGYVWATYSGLGLAVAQNNAHRPARGVSRLRGSVFSTCRPACPPGLAVIPRRLLTQTTLAPTPTTLSLLNRTWPVCRAYDKPRKCGTSHITKPLQTQATLRLSHGHRLSSHRLPHESISKIG